MSEAIPGRTDEKSRIADDVSAEESAWFVEQPEYPLQVGLSCKAWCSRHIVRGKVEERADSDGYRHGCAGEVFERPLLLQGAPHCDKHHLHSAFSEFLQYIGDPLGGDETMRRELDHQSRDASLQIAGGSLCDSRSPADECDAVTTFGGSLENLWAEICAVQIVGESNTEHSGGHRDADAIVQNKRLSLQDKAIPGIVGGEIEDVRIRESHEGGTVALGELRDPGKGVAA
nr:hypothetical protein [Gordonia hankookensis]